MTAFAPHALVGADRRLTRAELDAAVDELAHRLRVAGVRVLATLLDNGPAWVVADRSAQQAGVVHVPIPAFFTSAQVAHAMQAAGVDAVLTTAAFASQLPARGLQPLDVAGAALVLAFVPSLAVTMPAGTVKVTFTSGSTGTPKGVCLGGAALRRVETGLVEALAPLGVERHLCVLPFAVLLENIAGLMAPLAHGATCWALPLAALGLSGSSSFDVARFDAVVRDVQPNSLILLPQMLRAWVGYLLQTGQRAPDSLRMVAVGGAAVGSRLIMAAHSVGVPAFEGYGLSEGASVQTLNLPGAHRAGSAGRPLPHAQVRIAADGEIEVAGSLFNGYLGDAAAPPAWWPSGDIGHLDDQGYLHVAGRKKNLLITGFGRNVSPEWVETALRSEACVLHAVVFGDNQPQLSAVIWPLQPTASDAQLQAALERVNATLPDYARIGHWVRARHGFDAASGMATLNGRPQRDAILRAHPDVIQALPELSN